MPWEKGTAIDFIVFANNSIDFRGFGQPVSTTRGGRDRGLRLDFNKDFAVDFIVFVTWFANGSIDFPGLRAACLHHRVWQEQGF